MLTMGERNKRVMLMNMNRGGGEVDNTSRWFSETPTAPYLNRLHQPNLPQIEVNRLQLECSPSSCSNGFNLSNCDSPYSAVFFQDVIRGLTTHNINEICLDSGSRGNGHSDKIIHDNNHNLVVDDVGLSEIFSRMHVGDEHVVGTTKTNGHSFSDSYLSSIHFPPGIADTMQRALLGSRNEYAVCSRMNSCLSHDQNNALYYDSIWERDPLNNPLCHLSEAKRNGNVGLDSLDLSPIRPYITGANFRSQICGMDSNGSREVNSMTFYHSMNPSVTQNPNSLGRWGHKKIPQSEIANAMEPHKNSWHDGYTPSQQICESQWVFNSERTLPLSLAELQQMHMHFLAKDQNGCRMLQRMLDGGTCQDIEMIFQGILQHVIELMMDPFGNYLVQKFLDVCSEQQKTQILFMATKQPGQLVRISLDIHGTRVVQKLIETAKTKKQISLIKSSLEPGFLHLVKDLNGNHVIQRCLQCLSSEINEFIFEPATRFCVDMATHQHGCCVLQRCIDYAKERYLEKLVAEICRNGLLLAQDPFGNYVVQYILEMKIPYVGLNLISQFKGHYLNLSMQKFSSHVVEKCLEHVEDSRSRIVQELLSASHFGLLLQDPYANYVIQSALEVTKGDLHDSLVEAVRSQKILRTSPYCKRIFSRNLLKK